MSMFGARAAAVGRPQQQPVDPPRLCCPNPECGRDDCLRVVEQAQLSTPAVITLTVGTTMPEITADEENEEKLNPSLRTLIGVSCSACRFSYVGPNPLGKLRTPT